MKLTEFFMKRPTLFWSLAVFMLVAGILAFVQMPKLEDPAVAVNRQWSSCPIREQAHTR